MPTCNAWETFAKWTQEWGKLISIFFVLVMVLPSYMLTGDVIYTTVYGQPIIILISIDAARDLFDKRGANYSDRPRAVVLNEMWALPLSSSLVS